MIAFTFKPRNEWHSWNRVQQFKIGTYDERLKNLVMGIPSSNPLWYPESLNEWLCIPWAEMPDCLVALFMALAFGSCRWVLVRLTVQDVSEWKPNMLLVGGRCAWFSLSGFILVLFEWLAVLWLWGASHVVVHFIRVSANHMFINYRTVHSVNEEGCKRSFANEVILLSEGL